MADSSGSVSDSPAAAGQSELRVLETCGRFQWLVTTLVVVPKLTTAMCIYFMAFGAYNPGWRCLDDDVTDDVVVVNYRNRSLLLDTSTSTRIATTTTIPTTATTIITRGFLINATTNNNNTNATTTSNNKTTSSVVEYTIGSCDAFKACKRVEFNPAASTIVTEWGLVCDRAWVLAFVTAILMAGLVVGTLMLGYFGDAFGRKWTFCWSILVLGVLNFISVYSVNWEMFVAVRFFMGLVCAVTFYGSGVLASEFIPAVCRPLVQSLPLWNVGMLIFCVCAMATHNWKTIHVISAVLGVVLFLPILWVPESLRWLLANGKRKESLAVVKKIAKMNKMDIPDESSAAQMLDDEGTGGDDIDDGVVKQKPPTTTNIKYNFVDLFRKRFKFTAIVAWLFFSIDLVYFSTHLGVSVFPGNVYMNMIIMSASELPSSLVAAVVPNIAGRKITISTSFFISSLCFTGVSFVDLYASEDVKEYAMLGLVGAGKIFVNVALQVASVQVIELYPTVLRSTAVGFSGFSAGVGSIVAPYLIPKPGVGVLYVNYFITGAVLAASALLELMLPETKGKPLQDTWQSKTRRVKN